jgi:hypothetical protein
VFQVQRGSPGLVVFELVKVSIASVLFLVNLVKDASIGKMGLLRVGPTAKFVLQGN